MHNIYSWYCHGWDLRGEIKLRPVQVQEQNLTGFWDINSREIKSKSICQQDSSDISQMLLLPAVCLGEPLTVYFIASSLACAKALAHSSWAPHWSWNRADSSQLKLCVFKGVSLRHGREKAADPLSLGRSDTNSSSWAENKSCVCEEESMS